MTEPGDQIRVGAPGAGGTLEAGGPFTWTGPVYLNGDVEVTLTLTVSGSTTIGGTTTIKDSLTIEDSLTVTATTELGGVTTLKNDLNVQAPGKVDLGGIVLEPSTVGGGAINFAPTGSIFAGLGTLGMVAPDLTATLTVGNGRASVAGDIRGSEGLQIMDLPAAPGGTTVYQVVVGADGTFYRGAVV
ncbi:MAG: hypothetical protein Q7T71_10755 [Herbiconiux sp.]|nr:hypothetical protein [Herbiconiux sp.]